MVIRIESDPSKIRKAKRLLAKGVVGVAIGLPLAGGLGYDSISYEHKINHAENEYMQQNPPPYDTKIVLDSEKLIDDVADKIETEAGKVTAYQNRSLDKIRELSTDPDVRAADIVLKANEQYETKKTIAVGDNRTIGRNLLNALGTGAGLVATTFGAITIATQTYALRRIKKDR